MATKHHIGCHTKKGRIKYILLWNHSKSWVSSSGVATIFLVRGGSHKFFGLWGRNVIGSKFYFVKKKNTKQMLVCTLVGRTIRVQWLPTKDGTLVSHKHLWFHSILLKISDNTNFKCWSVLRQNFFFTFSISLFYF